MPFGTILLLLLVLFVVVVVMRSIRIVPQQTSLIIERLGKYSRTLDAGIHVIVPFVDKVRANIDQREQVVSFPPQPVITSDNLVVNIDTVIYYAVTDSKAAVYGIANFIQGIEQLTVTTLRNVIGSMDLEQTLTSRDQINGQLRGVLDEATGKWGIRVSRVELKAIDPPHSVQDSMEKQMRAERDRRAAILTAEGVKQSAILEAEGEKQSQILRAEGSAQARILEAQGQARAIKQVFEAIHKGKPNQQLLAYQYLQILPQLARGDSNKMWIVPSEFTDAMKGFGNAFGAEGFKFPGGTNDDTEVDWDGDDDAFDDIALQDPHEALRKARDEAASTSAEAEGTSAAIQGRGSHRRDPQGLGGRQDMPVLGGGVPGAAPGTEVPGTPVPEAAPDPATAPDPTATEPIRRDQTPEQ
ncbi:SPFH domain-containing protein [Mobilicoccus massiliensis]|uniref:SPFH domain-containing protein n=1 Tax=Mobilicoccus massiliensis TaxID=1522310 RepID=UPI000693B5DD|nr:SPFH domain-containing protein [Mobilicoccus massiliensis]